VTELKIGVKKSMKNQNIKKKFRKISKAKIKAVTEQKNKSKRSQAED
jgi:hypothetical protein